MNLRSLLSVALLAPLHLGAQNLDGVRTVPNVSPKIVPPPPKVETNTGFHFSANQLDADYARMVAAADEPATAAIKRLNEAKPKLEGDDLFDPKKVIPIMVLTALQPAGENEPAPAPPAENGVETPEELRIRQLELELAAVKKRLAKVEPFEDPEWPKAKPKPRKRYRFAPRSTPRRISPIDRSVRKPLHSRSQYAARFKPFTAAAMKTKMNGPLNRAEGQIYRDQLRFYRNTTKSLGVGITSPVFNDIRMEIQKAMLDEEINSRYAAQYLADIADVFRKYERMESFGLEGNVSPPMSGDDFRRDPDTLFYWVANVNERSRKIAIR